ncbi:MAG TPA: 3-phosphoshikimate 1-carboxyvinyltransferase [Cyclobacteriaceae bacterium]|nr:3-phosphoshikimate 1-carboxyvinyltransferase [Cyclobacteriaceae bacterium]HMV89389.1 3-phosphoshikimate 1-carboxyvinyltransferase [Cyclobacteriaceae bacterium]HMX02259.1 3-phosphoshikimate 1-carboxyvinyltransferase [Cyclobacteriaceae bacterium]HMX51200.1 3-phosphoshikimate 1-carboxyvinyltransferase [Cyclobacteriaceae bacterium]HMY93996.1 3-phosphoshikimate 1-carboxyvinyltransferase [Cyclobacteriaceae bacterium]
MSSSITLYKTNRISGVVSNLPSSKSISNRAIIIKALAGKASQLLNLSDANDTQLMLKLIESTNPVLDVEDAGTTMRFLTAFKSVTGMPCVITGTERMKQRPIKILVDALRTIGAQIEYPEQDGYPPVKIQGFSGQKTREVTIRGDVSSQYISALMMIAPTLPQGLLIRFVGKVTSRPYLEMTAALMRQFGAFVDFSDAGINIPHQNYRPTTITVESDWSAASYWFSFAALADQAEITLPKITLESLQGDRVIVDIMKQLGVHAELKGTDLLLNKISHATEISWDFTDCPDLAQTVAVVCAAKGIIGKFTGLESLRIKETDRIKALQTELAKIGATFEDQAGKWVLTPGSAEIKNGILFNTYLDHRMAMAFAPLAALADVVIEDPAVTRKSYPKFWDDVRLTGIKTKLS